MAMSRSYLAKKIHEIDVLLQRLGEDLPAEVSDRPDGASAPRRHARRMSAEVEHADRWRVTSPERLPPRDGNREPVLVQNRCRVNRFLGIISKPA